MSLKVGANHSEQLKLKRYAAEGTDPEEVSRLLGINEATCRHFMTPEPEEEEETDFENE